MTLGALDHVAVRVEDPRALGQFLQEVFQLERRGTETRALYDLPGGVTLAVFPIGANQGGIAARGERLVPDHLALRVDSLDAVRTHLAGFGHQLDGDMLVAPGGLCLQFVAP
jgi:predicted enzyme related to lactoylglutathione lyase